MLLAASNIGWDQRHDEYMYQLLAREDFSGLEVAPTRLFPENPYRHIEQGVDFSRRIYNRYGLHICSMQSICYGKPQRIFEDELQRNELSTYIHEAIEFAEAVGCGNLVFGCPKNRTQIPGVPEDIIIPFFSMLGEYAIKKGAKLSIEPNPVIYGTDFLNTTQSAVDFVRKVGSDGCAINIDFGTLIYNHEILDIIGENIDIVNHIHISEPNLVPLQSRSEHKQLASLLREVEYSGYVSMELAGATLELDVITRSLCYVRNVFY